MLLLEFFQIFCIDVFDDDWCLAYEIDQLLLVISKCWVDAEAATRVQTVQEDVFDSVAVGKDGVKIRSSITCVSLTELSWRVEGWVRSGTRHVRDEGCVLLMMFLLLEDWYLNIYEAWINKHNLVDFVTSLDYSSSFVVSSWSHQTKNVLHNLITDILEVGNVLDHLSSELDVEVIVGSVLLLLLLVVVHVEPWSETQVDLGILSSGIVECFAAQNSKCAVLDGLDSGCSFKSSD